MPVVFDLELCDGCGKCGRICPGDVIYMHRAEKTAGPNGSGEVVRINPQRLDVGTHLDKKSPYLPRPEECWHCGSCRQDCPRKAIRIVFSPDMLCM